MLFRSIARDLGLGVILALMKVRGLPPFTVTYLGKAATFNLLYALPLLLLTDSTQGWIAEISFILGWSFAGWGIALYLWTGLSYDQLGLRQLNHHKTLKLD